MMGIRVLVNDSAAETPKPLTRLLQRFGYTVLTDAEAAHVLRPGAAAASGAPPAQFVARGLLHRVSLLGACLRLLPDAPPPERGHWLSRIADANRRLETLYATGLARDFQAEPAPPAGRPQAQSLQDRGDMPGGRKTL